MLKKMLFEMIVGRPHFFPGKKKEIPVLPGISF